MPGVTIGPCRIADSRGTYEPGDVVDNPSAALLELVAARAKDPETGQLYAKLLSDAKTADAVAAAASPPTPAPPDPTPTAAPEKT
jgi:hypothetical protein